MAEMFTCEHCGGTFEKAWSDDEAGAELEHNRPIFDAVRDVLILLGEWESTDDDFIVICDDCYRELMPT